MTFKWIEVGSSTEGQMFFIVPQNFDSRMVLHLSEAELAEVVIGQAQTAEWATKIVAALNAPAEQYRSALQRIANLPLVQQPEKPDPHLRARRIAVAALGGDHQNVGTR